MNQKDKREQYVAPLLEEVTYVVEEGFAESWFEPGDILHDPPLFTGGDPDDPDYFMGGPLGEETW